MIDGGEGVLWALIPCLGACMYIRTQDALAAQYAEHVATLKRMLAASKPGGGDDGSHGQALAPGRLAETANVCCTWLPARNALCSPVSTLGIGFA